MILSSSGASRSMRGCICGCACARAPRAPPAANPATAPAICSARRRVILLWSCMAIPPSQLRVVVRMKRPSRAAEQRDERSACHSPRTARSHSFTAPVVHGRLRFSANPPYTACAARLLLHAAPHGHLGGPASIDVARVVHADAFRRAGVDRRLWYEGGDLAVLDAADADALLEARIVARGRLRIGDVDHVVLLDGNVARPPELLPFGNELAVRLENLIAVVGAVGDVDASHRIESDAVRRVEFARPLAVLAPRGDECPVLGELDDAVVGPFAVPIDDVDFAVGRDHDRATRTQIAGTVAGHSRLAQNHQYLAVGGKLDEISALTVPGDLVAAPHIAFAVYIETVRNGELVCADRLLKLAGGIELHDRRDCRIRALSPATTLEHPDALAIAVIDLDLDGRSEFPTLG